MEHALFYPKKLTGQKYIMNKPTHWTITLEAADDESGDLVLPLTDEIMESAGWQVGDTLEWIDNKNGTWSIKKIENGKESNPTE